MSSNVKILEIIQETPDVKTFRVEKPSGYSFIPGQYCLIGIEGKAELKGARKPFTFSNSPTEDHLDFTIKEVGTFTKAMFSLEPGEVLNIGNVAGSALIFDGRIKEDAIFIAGGSGITPLMSAIRYSLEKQMPNEIILLYSNRTAEDIIYKKELDGIGKFIPRIRIINTITDSIPEGWTGETGRINKVMIEKYVAKPENKIWYVCGPPPMIEAIKSILNEIGVTKEQVKVDPWQIPGKQ